MTAPTASAIAALPAWTAHWPPLTHEPSADEMQALFEQLTYTDIAKTIDHSLLRPELDDAFIDENLRLAARIRGGVGDDAAGGRCTGGRGVAWSDVKVGTSSASRTATT